MTKTILKQVLTKKLFQEINSLQKNNISTALNYWSIYYNQIQSIKFHNFEYITQIEETVVTMI